MLTPSFDQLTDNFCGAADARVELVEYGDFQCRNCALVFREIKILQDILGDDLRFVFRHFPSVHLDTLSLEAAIATEAAAGQHKFWTMHNILFQNQASISTAMLTEFAEDADLNMELHLLKQAEIPVFKKVLRDFEGGILSGVTATPAFFINGFPYAGNFTFKSLYKISRQLLAIKDDDSSFK